MPEIAGRFSAAVALSGNVDSLGPFRNPPRKYIEPTNLGLESLKLRVLVKTLMFHIREWREL